MDYKGLISRLGIAGFELIEPAILVSWALGWPIRLIGRPGTAKTRLADLLSIAENGPDAYRRLNCPAETIITIAGMPDLEEMKKGFFGFVHETPDGSPTGFIWDKLNITYNELTRISSEAANILLEPLQEGTLFGQPLPFQRKFANPEDIHYSTIATENPDGVGIKRVDPALFDRFYMAVNVPDGQVVLGRDMRRAVVGSNLFRYQREDGVNEVLASFAVSLRREFAQILRDVQVVAPILEWGTTLWEAYFDTVRQEQQLPYVSNRRQGMVTEIALGFAAYQRLTSDKVDLPECCLMALTYGVAMPLQMSKEHSDVLIQAHNKAKIHLVREEMSPKDRFEAELQTRPDIQSKMAFIREHRQDFLTLLKMDERETILSAHIMRRAQPHELLDVHALLKYVGGHDELMRQAEIKVLGATSQAVISLRSQLARLVVTSFDEMQVFDDWNELAAIIGRGQLPAKLIKMLLSPPTDSLDVRVSLLLNAARQELPTAA